MHVSRPGKVIFRATWERCLLIFGIITLLSGLADLNGLEEKEVGELFHNIYGPEDHEGDQISNRIAEDAQGNLYFANEAGLLKFDGENWLRLPETGREDFTIGVMIDSQGRIWVAGYSFVGYYNVTSSGTLEFIDLTDTLPSFSTEQDFGIFWHLHEHEEEIFLISTYNVFRWDDPNWKSWRFDVPRRILPSSANGNLYIHARGTGLFIYQEGDFTQIAEDSDLVSGGIISVLKETELGLLVATVSNGLFLLNDGNYQPFPTQIDALIKQPTNTDAILLSNGNIALATNDGMSILDKTGGLVGELPTESSRLYYLYQSKNGTIWLTTTESIIQVPAFQFTAFRKEASNLVRHEEKLYFSNGRELCVITNSANKISSVETLVEGENLIWTMTSTNEGLLYGGDPFLAELDENEIRKYKTQRHLIEIIPSRYHESLVYAIEVPKLTKWERVNSSWSRKDIIEDISLNGAVEIMKDTLLGTTTDGKIYRIEWPHDNDGAINLEIVTDSDLNPLKFQWATPLKFRDTLVVITNEGLFKYDRNNNLLIFDRVLGQDLGGDLVGLEFAPLDDRDGWALWLPPRNRNESPKGRLGKLLIEMDGSLSWQPWELPSVAKVGKVEALLHEVRNDDEYLWVGGAKNLFRYNLSEMQEIALPEVSLTSILEESSGTIFYGGYGKVRNGVRWSYPQKSVRIEFAAPSSLLEIHGYETRLVGFNNNWSFSKQQLFREFTNLNEGTYTFQVRAIDEFDRAGPTQRFVFTILPPWYRTVYAYFAYILLLAATVLLLARWWTLRLRRRNEELEKIIRLRTDELERRNLELIHSNKVKRDFLANMSHEIRNPLNGILGISQMLGQDRRATETESKRITHLRACASQLNELLGQILDYSSLDFGKLQLQPKPFDINKLLESAIELHKDLAQKKDIDLTFTRVETDRQWIGDSILTRQILVNLISNAVKYTTEGQVHVQVSFTESSEALSVRFAVEDSGPGIPKDHREYIFEDFTRLDRAGESQVAGSGLGLAIASSLVELMEGKLWLDEDYVDGARFVLEIDFQKGPLFADEAIAQRQPLGERIKGRKVLIADDMDFNRMIARELFERVGVEVDEASDGREALEKLLSQNYVIAILDINMPLMNGIDAVEDYLAEKPESKTILIALSAQTNNEMELQCLEAGFKHFMQKPLEPFKLEETLDLSIPDKVKPKTFLDSSLMDYLAQDNHEAKNRLQQRYQESFQEELANLRSGIIAAETETIHGSLHKLNGLVSIQPDPTIVNFLKLISKQSKDPSNFESLLEYCDEIESLLNNGIVSVPGD